MFSWGAYRMGVDFTRARIGSGLRRQGNITRYRLNFGGSPTGQSAPDSTLPTWTYVAPNDGTWLSNLATNLYSATPIDMGNASPAAPSTVYNSELYRSSGVAFTVQLPVTAGRAYLVILHLAELYFTSAGLRVFDCQIDGTAPTQFQALDRYALAGATKKAAVVSAVAVATANTMYLNFLPVVENAAVNGVELVAL